MLFRATRVTPLVPRRTRTPMLTFVTSLPVPEELTQAFSSPKTAGFPRV